MEESIKIVNSFLLSVDNVDKVSIEFVTGERVLLPGYLGGFFALGRAGQFVKAYRKKGKIISIAPY